MWASSLSLIFDTVRGASNTRSKPTSWVFLITESSTNAEYATSRGHWARLSCGDLQSYPLKLRILSGQILSEYWSLDTSLESNSDLLSDSVSVLCNLLSSSNANNLICGLYNYLIYLQASKPFIIGISKSSRTISIVLRCLFCWMYSKASWPF